MVPVVDIGALVQAVGEGKGQGEGGEEDMMTTLIQSTPELKIIAGKIHEAICQDGFCYLSNHGLLQEVVDEAFSSSRRFFELEEGVKARYAHADGCFHGYYGQEKEKSNVKRPHGDLKELFNYSPNEEKDLPTEVPEFSSSLQDMFSRCRVLVNYVLDLMGVALELEDPGILRRSVQLMGNKGNYTTLRTLCYPAYTQLKEGQLHTGEHSDYGCVTLLFQDDTGGLQIQGKDGEYHDVAPVPGAVLVNVGTILQRWTADRYPATKHRVIIPPDTLSRGRCRQSLVFFCQPDDDAVIKCLDGSDTYPPVTASQYLVGELTPLYR